jgi:anhydro-N-acetylmuramic acid kinase
MSGSSLDGLDIVYCRIDSVSFDYEIIHAETIEYDLNFYSELKNAHTLSGREILELDIRTGFLYGNLCNDFINKYKISHIDFISSHGHTVFHEPIKGFSLQLGNGNQISKKTGIKTITNLRNKDITYGGQGAPIVPLADLLLFKEYMYCLNLGGISNISIKKNQTIFAYDLSICNQILNHYAQKLGKKYDENGTLSKLGTFCKELFDDLNNLNFCKKTGPKSLSNDFLFNVIEITTSYENKISSYDILNTCCHHIAFQIAKCIEFKNEKILITGGGTYNQYLIKCIELYNPIEIIIPSENTINYKESLAMSLIGLFKLLNKPNVFGSVTGATINTVNGEIYN